MSRQIVKGATDESVIIRIVDSTDGTPETGVEHNTSGIDLWYRRNGGAKVSITEASLASADASHSDGGIEHIGDGYYRLDLPDAAFASGASNVFVGGTVTGMVVIGANVELLDPASTALNTVRKNTALAGFPFKMVDATDLKTAETGVTVTATRSLDGAAFSACANSAAEVSNGFYKIDLAAGDLNGNTVVLRFTGTGCHPTEITLFPQPA